jgi:hypothetical protein
LRTSDAALSLLIIPILIDIITNIRLQVLLGKVRALETMSLAC